jgi:hypothetical protein
MEDVPLAESVSVSEITSAIMQRELMQCHEATPAVQPDFWPHMLYNFKTKYMVDSLSLVTEF